MAVKLQGNGTGLDVVVNTKNSCPCQGPNSTK